MAKVSPVSIKYMIHAKFVAEGALEKPDVIGALFGQTEGLLGSDLEMRELQKEGKIGRIEVYLERADKVSEGKITIPTALDQSETTLIAAAIETIDKIGPCDAQIEIERIEDVRGSKRDYIIERAKKLMHSIEGSTDSRAISNEIKTSTRTSQIQEYGDEKLPCGDLTEREIIVVEGRADVLNLLRSGVKNVIAMNGTKLPNAIKELSEKKELTLFVDGDRGGKLIARNVCDNARVAYIANAPDGKEVEELEPKEVLMNLRKKVTPEQFFREERRSYEDSHENTRKIAPQNVELTPDDKEKLKDLSNQIEGTGKTIILDSSLEEIGSVSSKSIGSSLRRTRKQPSILVIDGVVTGSILKVAEEAGISVIVAKNFSATNTEIKLLSF